MGVRGAPARGVRALPGRDVWGRVVLGGLAVAAVAAGSGCTGSSEPGVTPGTLRGAVTQPAPSAAGDPATTTPSPSLSQGFDCTAVRAATDRLDATITRVLDRYGLSPNSPAGFDLTVVITAEGAAEFWGDAVAVRPPSADATAERVARYWAGLRDQVRALTGGLTGPPADSGAEGSATTLAPSVPATLTPAQLDALRRRVEALVRAGDGAEVARDERGLRSRMARACPRS